MISATTKLEKRAIVAPHPFPGRGNGNGWANFVVGVMLSVGPFPRLARRPLRVETMIRIAIKPAAFEAIAAKLTLGAG